MELFQVVTFATDPLHGNPAYVLSADRMPGAEAIRIAFGLLETGILAVLAGVAKDEPELAFFTPAGPHPGAGHSALAAAHIAFAGRAADRLRLRLPDGSERVAQRSDGLIRVAWPVMPYQPAERLDDLGAALGNRPVEAYVAPFGYVAVYRSETEIAALSPILAKVSKFDRAAVIATAPGGASDIVIRVFAPNVGLPEDPVCGTAHRIITPYWAARLGKSAIHSRHLSLRGGDLWCEVDGDTVSIAGRSVTTIAGTLNVPL